MSDTPWHKRTYKRDTKNRNALLGKRKASNKGWEAYPERRPVDKLSAPPITEGTAADIGHAVLDVLGLGGDLFFGAGAIADAANAVWYAKEALDYYSEFKKTGYSAVSLLAKAGQELVDPREANKLKHASDLLTNAMGSATYGALSAISIFPGVGDLFAKSLKYTFKGTKLLPKGISRVIAMLGKHSKKVDKVLDAAVDKRLMTTQEALEFMKIIDDAKVVAKEQLKNPHIVRRMFDMTTGSFKIAHGTVKGTGRVIGGVAKGAGDLLKTPVRTTVGVTADYLKYQKLTSQAEELINPEKNDTLKDTLSKAIDPTNKESEVSKLVKKFAGEGIDVASLTKMISSDNAISTIGQVLLAIFAISGVLIGNLFSGAFKSIPGAPTILKKYNSPSIPPGGVAILAGDSQMAGGIGKVLESELSSRGTTVIGGPGSSLARPGRSIGQMTNDSNFFETLEKTQEQVGNTDRQLNEAVKASQRLSVVLNLGGNGSTSGAARLVQKIHKISPKALIIFLGPPPPVVSKSGSEKYLKLFKQREEKNKRLESQLSGFPYVKFVDPYDYVLPYYKKGGDGLHMPAPIAKKYISDVLSNMPPRMSDPASMQRLSSKHDKGSSQSTRSDLKLTASLSGEQLENSRIIYDSLTSYGFSDLIAKAAIVNAYAESGLRSSAVGDSGNSIGLFQVHRNGAATLVSKNNPNLASEFNKTRELYKKVRPEKFNKSFAAARLESGDVRFSPEQNTAIIAKVLQSGFGRRFQNELQGVDDIPTAAALFSKYIERPKDKELAMKKRYQLAKKMFSAA